jgi:hypothetical protein
VTTKFSLKDVVIERQQLGIAWVGQKNLKLFEIVDVLLKDERITQGLQASYIDLGNIVDVERLYLATKFFFVI